MIMELMQRAGTRADVLGLGFPLYLLTALFRLPHNICGTPFLGNFVTLCAIGHHVGHNGIAETALVLVHQNWLAAMMREVVLQVATEV